MFTFFHSLLFQRKCSALRQAIINDDTKKILRILNASTNYLHHQIDDQGNTALILAVQYCTSATVLVLIQYGAQLDQTNFLNFQTPLGLLASSVPSAYPNINSNESLKVAQILLDHGAYVDKTSCYTWKDHISIETPLMSAIRTRNLAMVSLLIENKANVNYIDKKTQLRPIHYAISNGDVAMFDLLENAGASCRSVLGPDENTLLHWFCLHKRNDKQISLLKRIIDQGCDLNALNIDQRTPLMLAAKLNMLYTCRILLDAQVQLDQIDRYGYRAIDLARPSSKCWSLLKRAPMHPSNGMIVWRQMIDKNSKTILKEDEKHLGKTFDDPTNDRSSSQSYDFSTKNVQRKFKCQKRSNQKMLSI